MGAFQKQPNVFLNKKRVLSSTKKTARHVKSVGLGFKTPREAYEGSYIDKKCPFTGNCSIRGRILTGVIIKMKMQRTIVTRRDTRTCLSISHHASEISPLVISPSLVSAVPSARLSDSTCWRSTKLREPAPRSNLLNSNWCIQSLIKL